jgi:predicted GNAT family acetyltransferase
MSINVKHNRDDQQFEAEVSGGTALISYNEDGGVITFLHTEVPVEAEGKGVARALVVDALEYARDNKLKVVPECEYVASYVKKHREYDDIVDPEYLFD